MIASVYLRKIKVLESPMTYAVDGEIEEWVLMFRVYDNEAGYVNYCRMEWLSVNRLETLLKLQWDHSRLINSPKKYFIGHPRIFALCTSYRPLPFFRSDK